MFSCVIVVLLMDGVSRPQTELDTLSSTLRQLEHQKGAAQQRLDDLGNQVSGLHVAHLRRLLLL